MGEYSKTLSSVTIYSGYSWETLSWPAITIGSGEAFSKFKITKSNATLFEMESCGIPGSTTGRQTLEFNTEYTHLEYINNSLSSPKVYVRNTSGQTRTSDFTLTVYTTVTSKTITVSAETGGTASASASSATPGTTITITCSPNTGYSANTPTSNVSGVTFTAAGANKWTFTMPSSAITVSCTFTHVSYTVTAGVSPSGSGTLTSNKASAYYNDTVQLARSATAGWQFSSWTTTPNNLSINASTLKFTMPAQNVSVTANFTKINYSVSVSSNPAAGGTLTRDKATAQVGDTVTLTRTPATGYQFSSWTTTPANLSINASTLKFTMPAQAVSVTANWSKIGYAVSTSVSSGSGTLTASKSTANYQDTITVTAAPSTGYSAGTPSASGITFTAAGTNKWTFVMPAAAVAISISFTKNSYNITRAASPSGAGTVYTKKNGTDVNSANYQDSIAVSQTPASGYYFNGWTTSPSVTISSNAFSMPASAITVTANYLKYSTATLSSNSVTCGGSVTLNIVADKTTYTHKYKLSWGTNMETSLTDVAAGTTSVTISIPDSWANQIPNATSKGSGTLTLETYNGSTKIGTYTITGLTFNVRTDAVPTFGTCTAYVARTINGTTYPSVGTNIWVQNKCGMRVTGSAAGALGSSISSIEVSLSGYNDNSHKTTVNAATFDWTSGLLTVSGTCTITIKATDSRGRIATKTANITIQPYNKPNGTLTVKRVNAGGTVDPLGTYATYEKTSNFTTVGNNSMTVTLTSQGNSATNPANSGNLLPSSRQTFGQTQEYTISMTMVDAFETVTIQTVLPTAQFMVFVNANGDRIAFMKATNDSLDKNGKDGTIEFSANHQMYIGSEKAESYFTPATTKSWQYNRVHWHIPQDGNTVGFTFNINSVNYLWGSFHIHTRFGFHTLIFATDGSANIQVRTHVIDAFNSETLTATVSGRTVTVTSSVNWNYFDVDGLSSQATSAFNFTRILQS